MPKIRAHNIKGEIIHLPITKREPTPIKELVLLVKLKLELGVSFRPRD